MIYFLIIFTIMFVFLFFRNNKINWFYNIKAGDSTKVRIYSVNCNCVRDATVIKPAVKKFINAELSSETKSKCEECAFINSKIDSKSNITCWYNVDYFNIHDVKKEKNKYFRIHKNKEKRNI